MNQEFIEFRAKSTENDNWIYGTPVFYPSGMVSMFSGYESFDVRPETICQFIGKLKNGDKIYINDMIQHGETVRIVEYRNGNTCLIRQNKQDTILFSLSENPKKVGNIFDNPELIEAAN